MKQNYHPKAFLSQKRNVKLGLSARTRVILALEKAPSNIKSLVDTTRLSYNVILHHLRLLEAEKVTTRKGSKPHVWQLTGMGQQRLGNTAVAP